MFPARAALCVAVLAVAIASPGGTGAEVYKCVGAGGAVTYQQERCGGAGKGASVDLQLDNASSADAADLDGRWRIAAQRRMVVSGMPKRWVQQALGQPADIRRGTAAESVGEVWTYTTANGPMRVGFRGNTVAWTRGEGAVAQPPVDGAALADPRRERPEEAQPAPRADALAAPLRRSDAATTLAEGAQGGDAQRSRVAVARNCDEVLAALGPPARREALQAAGAAGQSADAARFVYEPLPGGLPVRLSFTCIGGNVATVSRDIPR